MPNEPWIRLPFSPADRAEAIRLGAETHAIWCNRYGHYRNSPDAHERGKCGEIACYNWLSSELGNEFELFPAFRHAENANLCDIVVANKARIEVKCWNIRFWPIMGRCVAVNQLPDISGKADYVFWAVSDPGKSVIDFVGWNRIDDVARAPVRWTGPEGRRKVQNYQLDDESLRSADSFVEEIQKCCKLI